VVGLRHDVSSCISSIRPIVGSSKLSAAFANCYDNIVHLHCLQTNFSNNSIGSLSNGVYSLNLSPLPSKPFIVVVRHICLTSCNITNLRDLCAHPVLISFRFPRHNLSFGSRAFRFPAPRVSLELNTCQHSRISVTSYFQTSSKDILLLVSLPHFSCSPCLECLCPRALILLRLCRYMSFTYLLTYL